jgi:hypothetical protein
MKVIFSHPLIQEGKEIELIGFVDGTIFNKNNEEKKTDEIVHEEKVDNLGDWTDNCLGEF